jgi:hypothetical protein
VAMPVDRTELRLEAKGAMGYEKSRLPTAAAGTPGKTLEQLISVIPISPRSPLFGRAMPRDPNSAVADQRERQAECLLSPGYPHSLGVSLEVEWEFLGISALFWPKNLSGAFWPYN